MRFSYYLNPQTIEPEDDKRIINEMLDHTDFAIKNGFTDVWITDHNFTGYSAFSDAIIMAAAISQRLPGVHIGFALNVVPLMHPIRFVTQMNLLDQLTNEQETKIISKLLQFPNIIKKCIVTLEPQNISNYLYY